MLLHIFINIHYIFAYFSMHMYIFICDCIFFYAENLINLSYDAQATQDHSGSLRITQDYSGSLRSLRITQDYSGSLKPINSIKTFRSIVIGV